MAASIPMDSAVSKSEERKVIFASSLGTVFEWYDFYLYGSLAAIIAKHFFSGINETAAFVFALLAFAAGFAVRPFGAIVFGRLGDIIGRKYTFLVTILLMGISTFIVGLLPSYASIGVAAPIILITLRLLQGLALGGEYGGAATYVAEHAPQGKRGYFTSYIQTTATLGLFLSLIVILTCRTILGKEFDEWGWRIPFLLSVVLLAISVWIRMQLNESPVFRRMKEEGKASKAPLTESFLRWGNLKIVLIAVFGGVIGQAVVWYTGQFYALFFLVQTLKVDPMTANLLIAGSLALGTPFFLVFGALSDKIGRKPIILGGCIIAALTYFPLFQGADALRQPRPRAGAQARAGDGGRGPGLVLVPVQPGRHGEVHELLRHRQELPRTQQCELLERIRSGRLEGQDHGRRQGDRELRRHGSRQGRVRQEGGGVRQVGHRGDPRRRLSGQGRSGEGRTSWRCWRSSTLLVIYVTMVYGPDRRVVGRTIPGAHPLHVDVAAVSHRQRLVRRLPADRDVRDGGRDRKHLLRPVVSDRLRVIDVRHRPVPHARDEGPRDPPRGVIPSSSRAATPAQNPAEWREKNRVRGRDLLKLPLDHTDCRRSRDDPRQLEAGCVIE